MSAASARIIPSFQSVEGRIYLAYQRQSPGNGREKKPGNLADLLAGRPCDPRAFRRAYPDRWCEFLHRNFRSPLHTAVFFEVDERTARHWWEGYTGPQAWAMAFAISSVPGAEAFLTEAA
ncbi:hypothetical protein [Pseudogemmobacter sonorensis]|uniref:hypothetical protein n=1 Tax=Pseudogemmobacter sonorensis TaxID=2989681 RepID=UPI0036C639FB